MNAKLNILRINEYNNKNLEERLSSKV